MTRSRKLRLIEMCVLVRCTCGRTVMLRRDYARLKAKEMAVALTCGCYRPFILGVHQNFMLTTRTNGDRLP